MPTPLFEYAEFHLVDPELIESLGRDGAIVITIGGLMEGLDYLHLEGAPFKKARVIHKHLLQLHHTALGRKRLSTTAPNTGTLLFYYCSRCGARLEVQRCSGCRRRYKRLTGLDIPSPRQPTLPRAVYNYALKLGHRFERRRRY